MKVSDGDKELEVLVKWATNDNCYNPPHTYCHTRHFLRQKKDLKSIFPFALFLTTQLVQKKGLKRQTQLNLAVTGPLLHSTIPDPAFSHGIHLLRRA